MTKRLTIALIALVALVLVAVLPVSATYYNINNTINMGATVYIGEQQLNLTPAQTVDFATKGSTMTTTPEKIGWWGSAANPLASSPSQTAVLTGSNASFYVSPAIFSYTGPWYVIDPATGYAANTTSGSNVGAFVTVQDPSIVADVWDLSTGTTVTGGSAIQGDYLAFRINSNIDQAINPTFRTQGTGAAVGSVDIRLKSDSGNTYTSVYNDSALHTVSLTKVNVTLPSFFFGTADGQVPSATNYAPNWSTGAIDATGQNAYPAGVYTVTVESRLNGMKDNYKSNGADYTTKTVSAAGLVTIVSNTVKIEANKDSVVRSKAFSITLTGKANTVYHLWVKGTSTLSGNYDDQPPYITPNQLGVVQDNAIYVGANGAAPDAYVKANPATALSSNGQYQYQNGAGKSILNDVAPPTKLVTTVAQPLANGTLVYANITLSSSGTRTIQFTTTNWTKAQKYTIRVEQYFGGATGYKSDEVDVKVEKGAVTIVAAGDQSYYLGEEVKFSGTNTESQTTYLFLSGPNLGEYGSPLAPNNNNPRSVKFSQTTRPSTDDDSLVQAAVQGDNTWSYKWGTASIALDAGTYTVYATSQPSSSSSDELSNVAYGTVSIIIKKPFISATASQSTVAKGDAVFITGTAQGQPSDGVRIWILGKNYALIASQSVNSDASFSYEIKKEVTKPLYSGQYFIVAQHPMQNNRFDVYTADAATLTPSTDVTQTLDVLTWDQSSANNLNPSVDFALTGANSLQGSDAAEALIEAINSANVDDTYTKLQILVEEPVITIDTVGDRHVGDKFTITATTNLAVDDEVLFEVYSSSFQPTQKSQSGEFSGATGTVKVTKGDSGLNKLSFDVDASTFKPDEYLVKAAAVLQDATGTSLFNVLEAQAPTATPTKVANVTATPTTVATTVPTTVATPTKTPTQPGFGALVALIGLGASCAPCRAQALN